MATYNLTTDSQVTTLLTDVKSSVQASVIEYWLKADNLMPSGGSPLKVELEDTYNTVVSPYTLSGSLGLFLFNGPVGQTAYVSDTSGDNILADPGNIVYTGPTTGTQGDLLLGGDSSGFLQVLKGDNLLVAGTGADTLIGGSGTDYLYGNMGSDLLAGTTGNAEMVAGSYYQTGAAAETLQGGSGTDFMLGGKAADSLVSTSGNDILVAGTGANTLTGGSGYDSMYSSTTGSTTIVGGSNGDFTDLLGGSAFVQGGTSSVKVDQVWAGYTGSATESDTIYGGANTVVYDANASTSIATQTVVGGLTELTFKNGQALDAKNTTINFSDGHSIKV
ncbi:calcium-binding protein [Rhodoblastus sp.]|uniref:calcium-binding protein n=1 Tax=Rhodoblastus sp. TaxID=1962975 RepID=UPI003F992B52